MEADDRSHRARIRAKRRRRALFVGALAFLASMGLGLAFTLLIVFVNRPRVLNPTEAYEGFGETTLAWFQLVLGSVISLFASTGIAAIVATRVKRGNRAELN